MNSYYTRFLNMIEKYLMLADVSKEGLTREQKLKNIRYAGREYTRPSEHEEVGSVGRTLYDLFHGGDVQECEKRMIATGDASAIRLIAQVVDGINIDNCIAAVETLGDDISAKKLTLFKTASDLGQDIEAIREEEAQKVTRMWQEVTRLQKSLLPDEIILVGFDACEEIYNVHKFKTGRDKNLTKPEIVDFFESVNIGDSMVFSYQIPDEDARERAARLNEKYAKEGQTAFDQTIAQIQECEEGLGIHN